MKGSVDKKSIRASMSKGKRICKIKENRFVCEIVYMVLKFIFVFIYVYIPCLYVEMWIWTQMPNEAGGCV